MCRLPWSIRRLLRTLIGLFLHLRDLGPEYALTMPNILRQDCRRLHRQVTGVIRDGGRHLFFGQASFITCAELCVPQVDSSNKPRSISRLEENTSTIWVYERCKGLSCSGTPLQERGPISEHGCVVRILVYTLWAAGLITMV